MGYSKLKKIIIKTQTQTLLIVCSGPCVMILKLFSRNSKRDQMSKNISMLLETWVLTAGEGRKILIWNGEVTKKPVNVGLESIVLAWTHGFLKTIFPRQIPPLFFTAHKRGMIFYIFKCKM